MEKEIRVKRGRVEIIIRHFKEGYLGTVNCLDDGEVEFGCSGQFCDNKQDAAYSALDYYAEVFPDAPYPLFRSVIKSIR